MSTNMHFLYTNMHNFNSECRIQNSELLFAPAIWPPKTNPSSNRPPLCHLDRNEVEWRDLPRIQITTITMETNHPRPDVISTMAVRPHGEISPAAADNSAFCILYSAFDEVTYPLLRLKDALIQKKQRHKALFPPPFFSRPAQRYIFASGKYPVRSTVTYTCPEGIFHIPRSGIFHI